MPYLEISYHTIGLASLDELTNEADTAIAAHASQSIECFRSVSPTAAALRVGICFVIVKIRSTTFWFCWAILLREIEYSNVLPNQTELPINNEIRSMSYIFENISSIEYEH